MDESLINHNSNFWEFTCHNNRDMAIYICILYVVDRRFAHRQTICNRCAADVWRRPGMGLLFLLWNMWHKKIKHKLSDHSLKAETIKRATKIRNTIRGPFKTKVYMEIQHNVDKSLCASFSHLHKFYSYRIKISFLCNVFPAEFLINTLIA